VGLYNQAGEFGYSVTEPAAIGGQYNYQNLRWRPESAVFDKARAIGLSVNDWQDVITVNMLGRRFYDETGRAFTTNNYKSINPYVQGSYLNAKNIVWKSTNWLNAAMAGIGDGKNGGGGLIWAIFDADALCSRAVGARAAACRRRRSVLLSCR
jgi:hypothetical protein